MKPTIPYSLLTTGKNNSKSQYKRKHVRRLLYHDIVLVKIYSIFPATFYLLVIVKGLCAFIPECESKPFVPSALICQERCELSFKISPGRGEVNLIKPFSPPAGNLCMNEGLKYCLTMLHATLHHCGNYYFFAAVEAGKQNVVTLRDKDYIF